MPPRAAAGKMAAVKKGPTPKASQKNQKSKKNQVEDSPKIDDNTKVDQPDQVDPSGSAPPQDHEDEAKANFEEDDKGERLELDESDPEEEDREEEVIMDEDNQEVQEDVEDHYEDADEVGEDEVAEEEDMEGEDVEDQEPDDEENEEEEEEQHDVVNERRKRKEFEVFVGGLDKEATEDDLRKVFSQVGEVTDIRLLMNPQTQRNKGFAFIRFATVEQARKACTDLKNPQVRGKTCGVTPSQDSDTLFLGNICKTWTKEALKDKLKQYGVENIEDFTLVEDPKNEGMNRGFAFLEFSNRSDAMNAYKKLQQRDIVFGTDRSAKVSFAETFVEPDEEIMAQVKTVFIDGMPPSWDENRVKESLKKHKEIEKVQLARNMPSARRRDFGFITFSTHEAAVACIEDVNTNGLNDGDNKFKVKARLSKPHQKGKMLKHGVRGGFRLGGRGGRGGGRAPWGRTPAHFETRRLVSRPGRFAGRTGHFGGRGMKRPFGRGAFAPPPLPSRHMPPVDRVRERRPAPPPVYARSSSRRDYPKRDELFDDRPVRASRSSEFSSRAAPPPPRRSSYRDTYTTRPGDYSDPAPPRGTSRPIGRRPPPSYPEETYSRRPEKSYRDTRVRDYDTVAGTKRPYTTMDDAPRYDDSALRHPRARTEYGVSASASHYDDYSDTARLGRSSQMGYGASRQDTYGLYEGRTSGMGYGASSLGGGEPGSVYSSYNSDYLPSAPDMGSGYSSSYYPSRGVGASYMQGPGSNSNSYY